MLAARSARAARVTATPHCRHLQQTQWSSTPTASCSYATSTTASEASTTTSADNEDGSDYRSQLLAAALPLIPEHGFSLKAIQEAARSIPLSSSATTSSNTSPLFLEQLFPSLPNRLNRSTTQKSSRLSRLLSQKPSERIFGRDIFKSAETPLSLDDVLAYSQTDAEAIGPRRALFDAWAEQGLHDLKPETEQGKIGTAATAPMGQKKLEELLERRLGYNEPVLQHLMSVLATLAKTNPAQSSLPSFKPYLSHVGSIASTIRAHSKVNISSTRLATVYSLAEFYQLSSTRPSLPATLDYARDMLESTRKYDGLVRDGYGFVAYAAKSWKNIIAARGM